MTENEKEALIGYMEFHLLTLVEEVHKHIDPDAIGTVYDRAYHILNDLEITLDTQLHLDPPRLEKQ